MVRGLTFITIAVLCSTVAATSGCLSADLPDEATQATGRSHSAGANYEAISDGAEGDVESTAGDGAEQDDPAHDVGSRCTMSETNISCSFEHQSIPAGAGSSRDVSWQVPLGQPPADGWPVVVVFQGALFPNWVAFQGNVDDVLGHYYGVLTVKALLDAGYAVLAPAAEAPFGIMAMWDTNVPPWSSFWMFSPDHAFMKSFFTTISAGLYGPLDASRMYATGMSSGGNMTSRMAVSYRGKFRALAIQSASYATCNVSLCRIPDTLPSDHPPTLFLHGEDDFLVPIGTMRAYYARLVAEGRETRLVVDPSAQHEYLATAPEEIVAWFDAHP